MSDFDPFGIRAIAVNFNCKVCGNKVNSGEINVPSPDYSADNYSDSIRDNDGYAVCPNCDEDYDVYVYAGLGSGHVDIIGVDDDDIDIIEYDEEYDVDDEIYPHNNETILETKYTGFKLNSLYIKKWRILEDLYIDFKESLNVMIGENGSGKSSVIEYIALIFGDLYRYFVEDSKKELEYKDYVIEFCSQDVKTGEWYNVSISNIKHEETSKLTIIVDDKEMQISHNKSYIINLLPAKIGLYYAGTTERLQELSFEFEEKYRKQVTNKNSMVTLIPLKLPNPRPFLYVKKEHIGIMLLSLLLSKNERIKDILTNEFGIDVSSMDIEFIFKKPIWARDNVDNVWGASDFFEQLIRILSEYSIEKKSSEEFIKITQNYSYINDEFNNVFKNNVVASVFEIFDFLIFNDLLDKIIIRWKNNEGELIDVDHLSEGEKQLLTIKALDELWRDQKGFLLLDEPDTFLHPKWQQDFISDLKNTSENLQVIITTHSPNIVTSLNKDQLLIMKNGKVINNSINPYGKKVGEVLVDHFHVDTLRDKTIQRLIDNIHTDLQDNSKVSSQQLDDKIKELEGLIDKTDPDILLIKLERKRKLNQISNEENK